MYEFMHVCMCVYMYVCMYVKSVEGIYTGKNKFSAQAFEEA